MKKAILIFGLFFFGLTGLLFGQFIFYQFPNLFPDPANGAIFFMGGGSVLVILYGILIWNINPENTDKINNAGYTLIKFRGFTTLILTIIYVLFCITYHDFSFPILLTYWTSTTNIEGARLIFLSLIMLCAFIFGLSIFATAGFSSDEYIDITYEEIGKVNVEHSRSMPYVDRGQFLGASFLGFILAYLFAFTPIILIAALYYITKFIIMFINKVKTKRKSEIDKKQYIESNFKKMKKITRLLTVLYITIILGGVLYTSGVFSLPYTLKEVKMNKENYSQYFDIDLGTKHIRNDHEIYYDDLRVNIESINKDYRPSSSFSYTVSLKYFKFVNGIVTSDTPIEYVNTLTLSQDTTIQDYVWNTYYQILDFNITEVRGTFELKYKMSPFYIKIIAEDNFKVQSKSVFDGYKYISTYGVYFNENTYVHSLFLRIKTNTGEVIDVNMENTFFSAGSVYTNESIKNGTELLLINGYVCSFFDKP